MNMSPKKPATLHTIDTGTDIIGDLSEWSCDPDTCLIDGVTPCEPCKHRQRVAELLRQRDLLRRPCTLDCTPDRPCERCKETFDYLAWLYAQRDQVAVLLRCLRRVANVFPEEFRELLAEPVADIVAEIGGRT